jgi:hypothetical protein
MQNERKAVTRLTLDLQLGDVQKSFGLTKGDVNRRLEFTLIDGGRPFEIPSNWTVWLVGTKPDETELKLGCVVERGRVIYDLASGNQLSACEGYFPIWLTIFNEAGEEVYSPGVGVDVKPGPNTMNSEDQNTAIAELIAKVNGTQEEVAEIQSRLPGLAREVQLSTLTILKNQWEDGNPKLAFGNVSGLFAFAEDTASRKVSILLLPVDNATRVESRSIGIEVTNVTPMTDIGDVTIFFSRKGDAPTMDLKYVVIAFSEPNETGEAFTVSAGFVGIGASSTDQLEADVEALKQQTGEAITKHDEDIDEIYGELQNLEAIAGTNVQAISDIREILKGMGDGPNQDEEQNQKLQQLESNYGDLKSVVDELLYVPISIDEFKSSVTSAEKGSTVTETTLSWVLNKDPEAVSLDGVALEPMESADYTLRDLAITANKKFTLSATDGKKTVTKDASINFYNGVYYGAATVPEAYNSAFMIALGKSGKKVLRGSKLTSFTVTAGAGEYIYYCLPVSMGACSFKVGGFDGGFDLVATLAYTNEYGHTEQYYIYRSANAGLGETNVEVK